MVNIPSENSFNTDEMSIVFILCVVKSMFKCNSFFIRHCELVPMPWISVPYTTIKWCTAEAQSFERTFCLRKFSILFQSEPVVLFSTSLYCYNYQQGANICDILIYLTPHFNILILQLPLVLYLWGNVQEK